MIRSNGQKCVSRGNGDKAKRDHERRIWVVQFAQSAGWADTTDEVVEKVALRVWKGVKGVAEDGARGRWNRVGTERASATRLKRRTPSRCAVGVLKIGIAQIQKYPAISILGKRHPVEDGFMGRIACVGAGPF